MAVNLRKEAKGRECQIRIPGACNGDPDTVVLAHLSGGGMGRKHSDLLGAWACSACHDGVDGRAKTDFDPNSIKLWHLEGMARTLEILASEDKIVVGK